jgi:methionine synthase I (cobalamin-dependent)
MKIVGATEVTKRRVREIKAMPRFNVIGGCCATSGAGIISVVVNVGRRP